MVLLGLGEERMVIVSFSEYLREDSLWKHGLQKLEILGALGSSLAGTTAKSRQTAQNNCPQPPLSVGQGLKRSKHCGVFLQPEQQVVMFGSLLEMPPLTRDLLRSGKGRSATSGAVCMYFLNSMCRLPFSTSKKDLVFSF
jgi:hypothetical protein